MEYFANAQALCDNYEKTFFWLGITYALVLVDNMLFRKNK